MIFLFNMGLPMIMPTMYFMVLALIPIVLLETWYVSKALDIRFRKAVVSIAGANVVSTLVGLPLTWLLLHLIQISAGEASYGVGGLAGMILSVTLQAPWLPPFGAEEFWMFHSAALFLLIPYFLATWLIEYVFVRDRLAIGLESKSPGEVSAKRTIFLAVRNANLLSYGLIAILLVGSLIWLAMRLQ